MVMMECIYTSDNSKDGVHISIRPVKACQNEMIISLDRHILKVID